MADTTPKKRSHSKAKKKAAASKPAPSKPAASKPVASKPSPLLEASKKSDPKGIEISNPSLAIAAKYGSNVNIALQTMDKRIESHLSVERKLQDVMDKLNGIQTAIDALNARIPYTSQPWTPENWPPITPYVPGAPTIPDAPTTPGTIPYIPYTPTKTAPNTNGHEGYIQTSEVYPQPGVQWSFTLSDIDLKKIDQSVFKRVQDGVNEVIDAIPSYQ
jgi:hypothetical protein